MTLQSEKVTVTFLKGYKEIIDTYILISFFFVFLPENLGSPESANNPHKSFLTLVAEDFKGV